MRICSSLVANVFEDRQLAVGDELGDLLDQLALGQHVGDFGNDQLPLAAAEFLDPGFLPSCPPRPCRRRNARAREGALAGRVGVADRLRAVDHHAAGREVRSVEDLHELVVLGMGIVDQHHRGIDDFGDVMAGDGGRHAHGNAGGTVRQEVREHAGEDFRLAFLTIVGGDEIDSALVQAGHEVDCRARQARFGVAIGCRVIAVDIAEVALPLHQRIAQRSPARGGPWHRRPRHRHAGDTYR